MGRVRSLGETPGQRCRGQEKKINHITQVAIPGTAMTFHNASWEKASGWEKEQVLKSAARREVKVRQTLFKEQSSRQPQAPTVPHGSSLAFNTQSSVHKSICLGSHSLLRPGIVNIISNCWNSPAPVCPSLNPTLRSHVVLIQLRRSVFSYCFMPCIEKQGRGRKSVNLIVLACKKKMQKNQTRTTS